MVVVVHFLSHVWLLRPHMDSSQSGSSVQGILQTRILEWVAISFTRGSSPSRDQTLVSFAAGGFFTIWSTREASQVYASPQRHEVVHITHVQLLYVNYSPKQGCDCPGEKLLWSTGSPAWRSLRTCRDGAGKGRGATDGGDAHTIIADVRGCMAETNTTL